MSDEKKGELVQHAGVFVDFWLGIAGAGAQALAEAVGKPVAVNAPNKELKDWVKEAVDRTAKGLRVGLDGAKSAAQSAERDLAQIHAAHAHSPTAQAAVIGAAKKLSSNPPPSDHAIGKILQNLQTELRHDLDVNGKPGPGT